MNKTINPQLSDTRPGDITRVAGNDFTQGDPNYGSACQLAKLGDDNGVPTAYFPTAPSDPSLYVIMAPAAVGDTVPIETPNTGENIRLRARGTGSTGDKLILMDTPRTGTITGTSDANPDVITTQAAHGFIPGLQITITGVVGDTAVNGTFYVKTVPSTTTFTISATPGGTAVAGNGAYVSGGSYVANGADAGKVRSLTGSLAPIAPGRYFRAAIAEENFVDGQLVRCRWFAGEERVTYSLTDSSGGTAATPAAGAITVPAVGAATTDTSAAKKTDTANAIATLAAEITSIRSAL